MTVTIYLPLLLAPVFALVAGPLSRRLPPRPATWLLSSGALLLAASTAASLGLLALPLVAQDSLVAEEGGWSTSFLAVHDPIALPIEIAALVALTGLLAAGVNRAARQLRSLRAAYRLAASLPGHGELAVVASGQVDAYALPGRPGRIVVSRSALRGLDSRQRRALLAHERAHLAHRHFAHIAVAALAAAANPLLRPALVAVRSSCERWADEAAALVAGREAVAGAIVGTDALQDGRAGSGSVSRPARALPTLSLSSSDLTRRLEALARPAPGLSLWRLAVLVLLVAAGLLALVNATAEAHTLFELAQSR